MANGHGGPRKNSGRKPGATTKRTKEIADAAIRAGLTPLEYLLSVLRDEDASRAERMDAAKSAAPYIHPRLNPVDANTGEKDTSTADAIKQFAEALSNAKHDQGAAKEPAV